VEALFCQIQIEICGNTLPWETYITVTYDLLGCYNMCAAKHTCIPSDMCAGSTILGEIHITILIFYYRFCQKQGHTEDWACKHTPVHTNIRIQYIQLQQYIYIYIFTKQTITYKGYMHTNHTMIKKVDNAEQIRMDSSQQSH